MSDMSKLIRLVQQYETISESSLPITCVVSWKLRPFQRASKIFDIWLPIRNPKYSNLSWYCKCVQLTRVMLFFYHISSETCWWKREISLNPMFRAYLDFVLAFVVFKILNIRRYAVCILTFYWDLSHHSFPRLTFKLFWKNLSQPILLYDRSELKAGLIFWIGKILEYKNRNVKSKDDFEMGKVCAKSCYAC